VSLPHSKSNGGPSDGQNRGKTNPSTGRRWNPVLTGLLDKIEIWCVTGFGVLGVFVFIPVGSRNWISELL
jgi:hypothetical protein